MDTQLADFSGEQWKDIPGYEGQYQISCYGRVKSMARYVLYPKGHEGLKQERILKLHFNIPDRKSAKTISIRVALTKEGKMYGFTVPRLVYNLFVAPFDMYDHTLMVVRKNEDPLDCCYTNLELKLASDVQFEGRATKDHKKLFLHCSQPVSQYDKDGVFIKKFDSIAEAAIEEGIKRASIDVAVRTNGLQAKKYYWRTGEPSKRIDVSALQNIHSKHLRKPIQKLTPDGILLETYESVTAAANAVGIKSPSRIVTVCKNNGLCKGYRWKYADDTNLPQKIKEISPVINKKYLGNAKQPVNQYDEHGIFVARYESIGDAAKTLGVNNQAYIGRAARKGFCMFKNFYWQFGESADCIDVSQYKEIWLKQSNKSGYRKCINQYDMDGMFLRTYSSVIEAAELSGLDFRNIGSAAKKEASMAGGYYWRFGEPVSQIDVSAFKKQRELYFRTSKKQVQKLTLDGQPLETYESSAAAAKDLGTLGIAIIRACRTPRFICKGFRWRFVE